MSTGTNYIENIKQNMREIRAYLSRLSHDELNSIYRELNDVLCFYGYENKGINYLYNYFTSENAIDSERDLTQLEEVTNAILFRLKYRQ